MNQLLRLRFTVSISNASTICRCPLGVVLAAATMGSAGLMLTGCLGEAESSPNEINQVNAVTEGDELKDRLDNVLEFTYADRTLSIEEHAAWQILHGALAYQADFMVGSSGGPTSAVHYLLDGGEMRGWTVRAGRVLDQATGRRGLIAEMEPGSKAGQGHYDQWLAVLSQCNLPEDQIIRVGDQEFTIRDYVEQVKWDVPRNLDSEFSWTLIGLTAYDSTDSTWTALDGEEWSIERLLKAELDFQLGDGACGGTHRLIGIAMTLNRRRAEGIELDGVWQEAQQFIRFAIEQARAHQNPDGTFSTNYITMPGSSADLAQNLGSTGHVLEFISIALTQKELDDPWVERSANALCDIFERTREVPLECGGLYHAAHGLVLYRAKRYGERRYVPEEITSPAP